MKELFKNKYLVCALLASSLGSSTASANLYVEYQDHQEKTDYAYYVLGICKLIEPVECTGDYNERIVNTYTYNTARVGYEFETGLYFEVGEDTADVGFKKSFNSLKIDLSHELLDDKEFTIHSEVRVRYSFGRPYIEYQEHYEKIDWSNVDWSYKYDTARLGYEFEAGLYFEVGEDTSAVGFKKSFDNFEVELDHERFVYSKNSLMTDERMHTDVRVRYTFGN